MDEEWLAVWNRERKGKQKALDPDSEADAELEARVSSQRISSISGEQVR